MILLTGGAGYIGSHTAVELIQANHEIVVIDNLSNSAVESIRRIETITGTKVPFLEGDIRDEVFLDSVFQKYNISAVIHFAGLKSVSESVAKPLEYYDNNVHGTMVLLRAMQQAEVKQFIFSSSATVYGEDAPVPYLESMPRGRASNPYGRSKAIVEQILTDFHSAETDMSITILRYFNPVGAHSSGMIGEDPKDIPNNLMPFVSQVAIGRLDKLVIHGDNYDTRDGTCERDYIHVVDLAKGHLCALNQMAAAGIHIFNLGTGKSNSVKEVIETFQRVNGIKIPYEIGTRRDGDLPACWACTEKAENQLQWRATRTLEDMMRDTWQWQQKNPNGYN
ncbi:UDP-galactose 4-epimerase [Pseudidiomarina planktonica]|uniref:UDP-glucose 4-epimerase n=1 Tax=Pseudidiomarina planktonica TaxID=1323738 RepID=A0A1Y6EML1_9GAMM|nr:UDP-glucose 4-epimerase GalE [Pseudidiomarina planktonica]RUO65924.1 UDP-glucose 4-epimerase GalE [Pseudidiomarina planktonica]SMQ61772.1 UDP-galactose 4-epimerase [Pseudidiomarina planktonica]